MSLKIEFRIEVANASSEDMEKQVIHGELSPNRECLQQPEYQSKDELLPDI